MNRIFKCIVWERQYVRTVPNTAIWTSDAIDVPVKITICMLASESFTTTFYKSVLFDDQPAITIMSTDQLGVIIITILSGMLVLFEGF